MPIEIDADEDNLQTVAQKLKEEFNLDVVVTVGGEFGRTYRGIAKDPDITLREVLGTLDYWKTTIVHKHIQRNQQLQGEQEEQEEQEEEGRYT